VWKLLNSLDWNLYLCIFTFSQLISKLFISRLLPDYVLKGNTKINIPENENVRHEITMPKLPKSKRARLSFHYLCGTTVAGADERVGVHVTLLLKCKYSANHLFQANCSLDISVRGPAMGDEFKVIHTVQGLSNNGSVSRKSWKYASVPLPPMHQEGFRVKITGVYNPVQGAFGLDNLRVNTEQKCYPR
jgi:hypothetical protein